MGEPTLKYTKVWRFGSLLSSQTEYISGWNTRSEHRDSQGNRYGPLRAGILNRDLGYRFELDLEAHIYAATRVDDSGAPVSRKPHHIEWRPSGRICHYHVETVDTGERRDMFDRMARRVRTRTTAKVEPQGNSNETETDGWYINPPAAWLGLHPQRDGFAYLGFSTQGQVAERDEVKFTAAGPRETGFPIFLKHSKRAGDETVIRLSEGALDPALFLPPADFKLVPRLTPGLSRTRYSFEYRARLRWEILKFRLLPAYAAVLPGTGGRRGSN
jgi:hypothetical protein